MAKAKAKSVTHGAKFEKVKTYYDRGAWNETAVKNAVIKGWITAEEFEEITGQPYEDS